ncbi:Dabb family protein [Membranihabitans marinus]|uniref:Dabb family protein n=1 Tax=Membranihabitans marinus TaxID=1227546 RepID=UPI001F38A09B|nr:Dabb family protein [Membranihabitans marinus]
MKNLIQSIFYTFILAFLFQSCIEPNDNMQGNFTHSVYFYLNNPESEADRAAFEKSITKFIQSSDYVMTRYLGTPAHTPREVVNNTWTYCLIVSFEDKEAHDKYQSEPVHKTFVEESEHLWSKVEIFDGLKTW